MELKGIDVSKWQGEIDWNALDVDFVIIRIGYSRYAGGIVEDEYFKRNVEGAKNAGIPWGVYVYAYDTTPDASQYTAKDVVKMLNGLRPEYPVYYDIEDKQYLGYSPNTNTLIARAFCDEIASAGYFPGIYSYYSFFQNSISLKDFSSVSGWVANFQKYTGLKEFGTVSRWVADYRGTTPDIAHDIWQYSGSGKLAGVKTDVDLNICYINYPQIVKSNQLNGWVNHAEEPDNNKLQLLITEIKEVLKKYEHD